MKNVIKRVIEILSVIILFAFIELIFAAYIHDMNGGIYMQLVIGATIFIFAVKSISFVYDESKPYIEKKRNISIDYATESKLTAAVRTYNKLHELGLISKRKRNERRKFYNSQLDLVRFQ